MNNSRRNTQTKRKKLFTTKMRSSLLLVFAVIFIMFLAVMAAVTMVNRRNGERYKKRVLSQQTYVSSAIPYKRGSITDRNGTVLATSIRVYNLIIEPKTILSKDEYREPTIQALTQNFDVTEEELNQILAEKPNSQYVVLRKKLEDDEKKAYDDYVEAHKEALKEEKKQNDIQGVWFELAYDRRYPLNDVACGVLGFTYTDNEGNWGLEEYYNDELNGVNGRSYGYYDSEMNLQRTVQNPTDGNSLVTTIDANVQSIVQKRLTKFVEEVGCKNIGCIMMNPNNGEVYAMAGYPFYDLNNPRDLTPYYSKKKLKKMSEEEQVDALSKLWRNFCVSDAYEPGSTFKPFTVAAAYEESKITPNKTYYCPGYYEVAGKKIGCAHKEGHGTINVPESIAYSCNPALMQIGERLGRASFYKYTRLFNFGYKTGIDLPGESSGITFNESGLNAQELATASFGQGQTVTMIQLMSAFCSLINDGEYYEPHIVSQVVNSNGAVVEDIEPLLVKRTVSPQTSRELRSEMKLAVTKGTAVKAQIEGFEIGGKTGTAEKFPRGNEKYLVSFIGFSPVENPQVAIYVIIDEPDVAKQANSAYAIEVAKDIMEETLPFLGVYSSKEPEKTDTKENDTKKEDGTKKKKEPKKDLPSGTDELGGGIFDDAPDVGTGLLDQGEDPDGQDDPGQE
ncbi:peptidoglycan D,D-transpeptidase FtsI family protein [Anaerolentibacter hominis]|uniref:peptidoglycan D,D-transpeptidase FtsI family protein n=1 Tax=Anaerolentibacter hominis TaxID=3079009 RepID=UPI0031B87A8E